MENTVVAESPLDITVRELSYSYNLLYDIKTPEQLQNEVEYLAHRLGGIASLCRNGNLSNTGGSLTLPSSSGSGAVNARLYYSNNQLETDLTKASGVAINDLRRSFALQRWLERNARGGARYIEQILSHFGVRSSDARLQRPEYLGGGRQPVSFSAVIQTSATYRDWETDRKSVV